jgi:bifunctional non-homologous end joining protein LigD
VRQREIGKVYIDALQNRRGKTLVGVYSLRAQPNAPASTPLKMERTEEADRSSEFNIATLPRRIRSVGDLFEPV